jgi:EpsI family protein
MIVRILVAGAMLMLSSFAVRAIGHGDPVPLREPFSHFPVQLGGWRGEDLRFSPRIENKLGVTDYVSRMFRAGPDKRVHLYVGFYSSQRHGEMIHSPKNCLPGNGWYVAHRGTTVVDVAPYVPFEVNSYTVENGIDRQVVLYWYQQSGNRIVTNEYMGRVHLVLDSLTKNRSDAALIRVSVPFEHDAAAAERLGLDFLAVAYPALSRFLPHDIATTRSRRSGNCPLSWRSRSVDRTSLRTIFPQLSRC